MAGEGEELIRAKVQIISLQAQIAAVTDQALGALQENAALSRSYHALEEQLAAMKANNAADEAKTADQAELSRLRAQAAEQSELIQRMQAKRQVPEQKLGLATPVSPALPAEESAQYWKRKYEQIADYSEKVRTRFRDHRDRWKDWAEQAKVHEKERVAKLARCEMEIAKLKRDEQHASAEVKRLQAALTEAARRIADDSALSRCDVTKSPIKHAEHSSKISSEKRDPLTVLPVNATEESQESLSRTAGKQMSSATKSADLPAPRPAIRKASSEEETQDNGKPTPGKNRIIISLPVAIKDEPAGSPIICCSPSTPINHEPALPNDITAHAMQSGTPSKHKRSREQVKQSSSTGKRLCVSGHDQPNSKAIDARRTSSFEIPSSPHKQQGLGDVRRTQSSGSLVNPQEDSKRVPLWQTLPQKRSPLRLPQQPKNIGRYASAAKPTGQLDFSDFAIDAEKNDGVNYAFQEALRGKDARKQAHAKDCPCCADYYRFAGPFPSQSGPIWRAKEPDEPEEPVMSDAEKMKQQMSRHRERWEKEKTPELHWRVDFPSTQEVAEEARLAEERRVQKLKAMEEEALSGKGRIIFRESKQPRPSSRKRARRVRE
ncbi:hypothetical protein BCR37DRAFT_414962 [Protomyces lactucae-debilis]|uniref:DNA endonuclease activator Ctp1 C-terminal domain-containing protein n=1 Tax=Protomyces lactucae-debilis TaxID=2754530 RepID=A0A1Y2F470_PROLT|nr:uncharacterized protein BCR37DRAFT_414962 [Protomyces lactucae-debilis]ORY78662.1 hypothetical protein BCR37DRAFT_414962 [Protomyces lactucae-debilis]